jgi:hypothetical protein
LSVATQPLKLTVGLAVLAYVGYQLASALAKGCFPKGNSNGGAYIYRQKEGTHTVLGEDRSHGCLLRAGALDIADRLRLVKNIVLVFLLQRRPDKLS